MLTACRCCIVPQEVLEKFSRDDSLPQKSRGSFKATVDLEPIWRTLRIAQRKATQATLLVQPKAALLAASPTISVYDCQNTISSGKPISKPASSADATAKRTYDTTRYVADFYSACFGRNSIDDQGTTLLSSIHYDINYNNAFWNGSQMTYGDGDGLVFIDFTNSEDVIAHELTHGVTEYTAGFVYTNTQAGALNESMSDVFGSMFKQWVNDETFSAADWMIGADIMGTTALAKGYKCLRDLSNPGAAHCMSKQPSHYANFLSGGGPHHNSGIPNHAFYQASKTLGGKSWEKIGRVWYAALTSKKVSKKSTFRAFAKLTRSAAKTLYPAEPAVYAAVDGAWTAVGLP